MASANHQKAVQLTAVPAPKAANEVETKSASANAVAAGLEVPGVGNIDKIRDIIFGNQMRDYEKRFVRLEERLMKESAELRDEVKRRLEQLESHSRVEMQTLTDRLKNEQEERASADQELTHDLREMGKTSDRKLAQLDEQTVKSARDLRLQLLEQSKQLSEDLRHKFDALATTIEREASELRGDKTDRAALAGLFTEMALRLSHDAHSTNE
jgi:DNA anti-recombination protein RmuC